MRGRKGDAAIPITLPCATCGKPATLVGNARYRAVWRGRAYCGPECGRAGLAARLSAAFKGRPKSPEHMAKLAAAHTGRPLSPEHRARVSAALLKGRSPSYHAVHRRMGKVTGLCRCGRGATDWALDPETPPLFLLVQTTGPHRGLRYSLDRAHYRPSCHRCNVMESDSPALARAAKAARRRAA